MTGEMTISPVGDSLQLTTNLEIPLQESCGDGEQLIVEEEIGEGNHHLLIEGHDLENDDCKQILDIEEGDDDDDYQETDKEAMLALFDTQSGGESEGKQYLQPVVGMEFESYDDAYNYYNCYSKELGFAIRVKSSWTKRNSKEKRGAVLCCNCEGFKMIKEVNTRRKETRTGCLAMIRLRLVESNRWKVDEVKIDHNHLFDPERAQSSKSHKKIDSAGSSTKRKIEPCIDVEVRTIKLYRTPVVDQTGNGSLMSNEGESNHQRLNLRENDAESINNYFCQAQLTNPNFFYLMDLNDDGYLRNLFWIDSKSRSAYGYFGDVVLFDTMYLPNDHENEILLFSFVGLNHHGEYILLGSGLLADESFETYIWLFRTWLTCMSGRPPQTIISDRCRAMQGAIFEVFPRAHHRFCLLNVMQSVFQNFRGLREFEAFQMVFDRIVYQSLKIEEFEMAWEDIIQRFGIVYHEWLRALYEDRERWAPVYSKDTFFAGMSNFQKGELMNPFFDHQTSNLKEFFEIYDLVQQTKNQKETEDDYESSNSIPVLKTRSLYELQLSKVYTNKIFRKFQNEVLMMSSCFSISQVQTNGSLVTYIVKERESDESLTEARDYEVIYDKAGLEVRCICSCFNLYGYLCRHVLCVLNYNGVGEMPFQYILSRWRKDFKRLYATDLGSNNVDVSNPVQWFDHLYKRAIQVVEEGMLSQDHFMVACQAFKESLNKMEEVSLNTEPTSDDEGDEFKIQPATDYVGGNPLPLSVGMYNTFTIVVLRNKDFDMV